MNIALVYSRCNDDFDGNCRISNILMGEKMKKIAIVTIESANYGNRLQNYALQTVLQSMGVEVKTLHRETIDCSAKEQIKRLMQNIFQTKASKFRRFDGHIEFSKIVIGRDYYPIGISSQFDYFVVGSDNQKISYAASFGVSEIPLDRVKYYAEKLKTFSALSVREKHAARIVKDLTNREATVVLDPTLLLKASEWKIVENKSKYMPKSKYVFVYALGTMCQRFKDKIRSLEKEYVIFDVRAIQKNGRELPIGPAEFLYLLRNADFVLTDSFHATVFSILYHKRFITFNRLGINMNSRIKSLAELIDIQEWINKYGELECEKIIDYTSVDEILARERKKSIDFLREALNN